MSKNEVLGLIMKHVKAAVPDFEGKTIETGKSYKDLGISSLDLVEIISNTMRDMKVKIPPTELANVKTTDDLIALLLKAKKA